MNLRTRDCQHTGMLPRKEIDSKSSMVLCQSQNHKLVLIQELMPEASLKIHWLRRTPQQTKSIKLNLIGMLEDSKWKK